MTFTGYLMAAVILFIALYFGYRAMYGEPRIDADDTSEPKWNMRKARALGKDHLYSRIMHKSKRAAASVQAQAENAGPKAFSASRTPPLFAETGEIGDVDGPDVSNTATRTAPLLVTIRNVKTTDRFQTTSPVASLSASPFEKKADKKGAGVVNFSQVASRTSPFLTETGTIGDTQQNIEGVNESHTTTKQRQVLPETHVQALLETGHSGSYQNEFSSSFAGDDTGGIAEAQSELPGLGSLITGVDVSSANSARQDAIAPSDSLVEGDGDMNHDEPYLGDVKKR